VVDPRQCRTDQFGVESRRRRWIAGREGKGGERCSLRDVDLLGRIAREGSDLVGVVLVDPIRK
jgi:hypothetical protein